MSLISADQTFALSAVIMMIVAAPMWAETRLWGQTPGGPLLLTTIRKRGRGRLSQVNLPRPLLVTAILTQEKQG